MEGVIIPDHPLIQHKLTLLRDKNTARKDFREIMEELSILMAYEVTRDMTLKEVKIETPVSMSTGKKIFGEEVVIIAILRAGLGMVSGLLRLLPLARVGHIGIYREPDTLNPIYYYKKLPVDIKGKDVIIVDPMLATGGTAVAAIEFIKNISEAKIKFVCLFAAPEGIKKIKNNFNDITIYTATIDHGLNSNAYIVPGLGDAGDRLFGTE